jgi:hypothetical protein
MLLLNKESLVIGHVMTSFSKILLPFFRCERAGNNENGVATARGRFTTNTETFERVAVS